MRRASREWFFTAEPLCHLSRQRNDTMKTMLPLALAALLALTGCGDGADTAADGTPPAGQTSTEREVKEAADALRDAGRQTGEAAGAAAQDLKDAAGPALDEARKAGESALDSATQGLNSVTRGAACQTARAANDAAGVAANCG